MINIDRLIDNCKYHLASIQLQSTANNSRTRYSSLSIKTEPVYLRLPTDKQTYFYWSRPDESHSILGHGELVKLVAEGEQRFQSLQLQYQNLFSQWHGEKNHIPKAFIGHAFDPLSAMTEHWRGLPNAQLSIPEITIETTAQHSNITINIDHQQSCNSTEFLDDLQTRLQNLFNTNIYSGPSSVTHINSTKAIPDKAQWQKLSEQAIQLIHQKEIDKLVFSRKLSLIADCEISSQKYWTN